jgi:hypothetical protein
MKGESDFRMRDSPISACGEQREGDSPLAKMVTVPMLPTAKRQMLRTLAVRRDGRAAEGLLAFWRGSDARLSLGAPFALMGCDSTFE